MKLLKVGVAFWVNAGEVKLIQAWGSRPAETEKKRAEAAGCYYNATTGLKRPRIRCLITLMDGTVVASPVNPETLSERALIEAPVVRSMRGQGAARETHRAALQAQESGVVRAAPKPAPDLEVSSREDTSDNDRNGLRETSTVLARGQQTPESASPLLPAQLPAAPTRRRKRLGIF